MNRRADTGQSNDLIAVLLVTADLAAVAGGALIGHVIRFGDVQLDVSYQVTVVLALLLTLVVFRFAGLYEALRSRSVLEEMRAVGLSWSAVVLALIVLGFAFKVSAEFSRLWSGYWAVAAGLLLLAARLAARRIMVSAAARGMRRRVLIVGSGELAAAVAERLRTDDLGTYTLEGFVDDPEYDERVIPADQLYTELDRLDELVDELGVDEVWICLPLRAEATIRRVLHALRHSTVTQRLVPDIASLRLLNYPVTEVVGVPMVALSVSPMYGLNRVIKAAEDWVLGALFLILAAPAMLAAAAAIKLTSRGPVLFRQMRHGWDGRPIEIYKFRTMVDHGEADGPVPQATPGDPRVTRVGRILRRTSLDELPQLINVLQGRMSLVGPRPHALEHNEAYKEQIQAYMQRHKVKPGITGWAQVHGWRGETDTLEKMQRRLEHDLYYVENWSLWLDLKILARTLFIVLFDRNAY